VTTLLISLDLGTTHSKAGLFNQDGGLKRAASRETVTHHHPSGYAYFDADEMWAAVVELITDVTLDIHPAEIAALGITSMAETGLLIDNQSGEARTQLIPWFDAAAAPQVDVLKAAGGPMGRFYRSGIRPNFKCSLAKLL
jgi:sugar (pentulose or hexulose) kinase